MPFVLPSSVRIKLGLPAQASTGFAAAVFSLLTVMPAPNTLAADGINFERVQLSDAFYSEGGTFADYNADGEGDVAVGPWIYLGPDFESKVRFYEGESLSPAGYSENFLMYSGDVNGDELTDIFVLGFPGKESWWYENPGKAAFAAADEKPVLWQRHTMLDVVDNESPLIADLNGDGQLDLICSSSGHYGFASYSKDSPREKWQFTKVSPNNGYQRFTHGLGIGDVNNDGHMDLMEKDGWWENPGKETLAEGEFWNFHPFAFSSGGSQMFAVDFDGDGKNEVLTGLAAHGFGLVYYKSLNAEATNFEKVDIMTDQPTTNQLGIAISQLHAVEIVDVNQDGVQDIVTGKRWWAHANKDPGNEQPATLVWLETVRAGGRVRFVPHIVDNSSGVGTQVSVGDVNLDGLVDIVSGTKRGAYLFLQRPADLSAAQMLVPGLAQLDPFGQTPAMSSVKLTDDLGGFRPALGERSLNFAFDADDAEKSVDWEVRGPIGNVAISEGMVDTGRAGPKAIGEIISRPFLLTQPVVSFLYGGSPRTLTQIEIIAEETGKTVAIITPERGDEMARQYFAFDLSTWKQPLVRVRIVDHANDGFVRFDDLRLHASMPEGQK